jgi:phosphoserine phosphatase
MSSSAKARSRKFFAVCKHYELEDECGTLDATHLAAAQAETAELNEDDFRVVAIAYKEIADLKKTYSVEDESDLTLLGYIAFLDPPKESAGAAIAALSKSGVAVKIITGDNEIITRKICREVGFAVGRIVLGPDIEPMSESALAELAENSVVFAKVSPAQKARVIGALHVKGHVVGFLGDGINDSAALKTADGREFELRQYVQRSRRQHLPALPVDAAHSSPHQQSALRFLANRNPHGQCRRGLSRGSAQMGHRQYFQIHGLHRTNQLDLRLRDFLHHALCLRLLE